MEILKKKQLKCYLYTRVSTSMQVDGYSLDAQRDKLRKYAAYEDMIVAGEYSDEGFSGKNIQGRQEFQRMLNDIQDGKDDVSYVLVFKLSRFGRNAADVLNSLQLMQDFGVNLICVEDGIDSSKDAGKLMISVLSAVAEIERENIRTQTMAGREQKAREGKWNGGFAPYGYKLENGNLVIAEDEVEVIRVIYDRYIHTNEGVAGVAKYLNRNGYVKKLRQNNTIPGFSRDFVKNVLYNPVYMGKIAYGRRRTEKKQGTRNEMHVVEQSEFPVYEGQHEAIISEEDWYLAQEKRKINSFKREKVNNPDHAHILSGILKCPCCGKSMYGNIAKAHSKDKKTRYYYYCKNTVTPTGHECSFRLNIEQTEINKFVAKVISAMVNNPRFVEAIQAKIGTAVDTEDMERQIAVLQIMDGSCLIRIKPMTEEQCEMSERCVRGLGYQGQNLLCSNWNVENMSELDYNGMFEYLYGMKYGEKFNSEDYPNGIPKEEFESLIMEYLPITAEQIREYAVFDEENQTYLWARLGCFNYAPTFFGTSLPEVVDIKENQDGTVTLTVEAVCDMVICDDAVITHELTVRFAEDGSFQYLGNEILNDGIMHIPDYQYRIKE